MQRGAVGGGLVVCTETVDHRCAGLVEPDDFHVSAFSSEFGHRFVKRAYRRDIPKMGLTDVNPDGIDHLFVIKRVNESLARSEENLAANGVRPNESVGVRLRCDVQYPSNLVGKEKPG